MTSIREIRSRVRRLEQDHRRQQLNRSGTSWIDTLETGRLNDADIDLWMGGTAHPSNPDTITQVIESMIRAPEHRAETFKEHPALWLAADVVVANRYGDMIGPTRTLRRLARDGVFHDGDSWIKAPPTQINYARLYLRLLVSEINRTGRTSNAGMGFYAV